MKVTPRTEQELQERSLMAEGIYPFEVIEAIEKLSSKGNEMIVVKLKIWDNHNRERILTDYLLDAMEFKIRHFAEHTGLLDKYNAGGINAEDCLNRSGFVEVITEMPRPKPEGGMYAAKNSVKDYHAKPAGKGIPMGTPISEDGFDQDIPF